MGYYINSIGTTFTDKVQQLKENHQATITDSSWKENLVCVVDNNLFGAAAYMYSEQERNYFAEMEQNGKRVCWLVVPNAKELSK